MNKSEEYIENESFVVVNPDYPVISKENALKAVDMAREEGANSLIEQASFNGQKKYQQGMDFMKYKAIEAFRQFVEEYCSESGRRDISEDSEHYLKVFNELINEKK